MKTSLKIYIGLILVLAILSALNIYLPVGDLINNFPEQELPVAKPIMALAVAGIMIVVYGGLGYLGVYCAGKLGFPEIWDEKSTLKRTIVIPSLVGVGIGIFFIIADFAFSKLHGLMPIPHPPFPTSIVVSTVAGIGEEVIFRLFYISFWTWLASYIILKGKWQNQIFWFFTILSAFIFAIAHMPSVYMIYGFNAISEIPLMLIMEILLLNLVVSIYAAIYFRKSGFLAAVMIHLWTDLIWHVLWGAISQ